MAKKIISDAVLTQAKSRIVEVAQKYIDTLEKKGKDWHALCPFHSEKTPSFTVSEKTEAYYCFGCGASGDAIDLVSHFEGTNMRDSVKLILGQHVLTDPNYKPEPAAKKPAKEEEWKPIIPVPDDISQQPMTVISRRDGDGKWQRHERSAQWRYTDANGSLIGWVFRFDMQDGGKEVLPQTYCVNTQTGECQWRWQAFPKPRPLYRLQALVANPNAQVLIVEGEKTADAAQALFKAAGVKESSLVVVSWPGGGKAVPHVDWSPLTGRKVGLWPDADKKPYKSDHPLAGQIMPRLEQPGYSCMYGIYSRSIKNLAASVKFIFPPENVPCGWDVADEFPPGVTIISHAKAASVEIQEALQILINEVREFFKEGEVVEPEPEPEEQPELEPIPEAAQEEFEEDLIKNSYFTILGYDVGVYYIFQHEKRQVMSVSKRDFYEIGLIELAEINWWERHFPKEKGGIDLKLAAEWFFRTANSRGVYDPSRIRGRGAWVDKGRHVYHHGDYLTVDGEHIDIHRMSSSYVYPTARRMPTPAEVPLSDKEGMSLLDVAAMVRWSMPASAALLAGWTFLAPICGALKWRPHIWLTGAAGTGKSSLQRDFCSALTQGISVYAQGNSTEAGIRQRLRGDALPVLLDEAECNDERERMRMSNVLSLIRQSSTDSQAETLKGTVSGASMNFNIRSMFCLASINTALVLKADIDRMTKLSIRSPTEGDPKDNWAQLQDELIKITKDETLPNRLLARALKMLPQIHKNIAVFTRVAAKHFGTQRDGDQFGTLLAGCWSLVTEIPADDEAALKMITAYNWQEHVEDHDQDDAARALQTILASRIRMPGSIGELSVYELIRETSGLHRDGTVDALLAEATLRRHGMIPDHAADALIFGITTPSLRELVDHASFATDLRGQLLRVPGAQRLKQLMSFVGAKSRCISVPLHPILGEKLPIQEEYPL